MAYRVGRAWADNVRSLAMALTWSRMKWPLAIISSDCLLTSAPVAQLDVWSHCSNTHHFQADRSVPVCVAQNVKLCGHHELHTHAATAIIKVRMTATTLNASNETRADAELVGEAPAAPVSVALVLSDVVDASLLP